MTKIGWKIGKATGGKKLEAPPFLKANEMAEVEFEPIQHFVVDSFKSCEVIIDNSSNNNFYF
jgi:elongation factor 1-alpha